MRERLSWQRKEKEDSYRGGERKEKETTRERKNRGEGDEERTVGIVSMTYVALTLSAKRL